MELCNACAANVADLPFVHPTGIVKNRDLYVMVSTRISEWVASICSTETNVLLTPITCAPLTELFKPFANSKLAQYGYTISCASFITATTSSFGQSTTEDAVNPVF